MILFESLAAGVATVAFDVGGIASVLEEDAGWLVAAGDVQALGQTIAQVLHNPDARAARTCVARRRLTEHFGAQAWIRRIEDVYATCLASRGD